MNRKCNYELSTTQLNRITEFTTTTMTTTATTTKSPTISILTSLISNLGLSSSYQVKSNVLIIRGMKSFNFIRFIKTAEK